MIVCTKSRSSDDVGTTLTKLLSWFRFCDLAQFSIPKNWKVRSDLLLFQIVVLRFCASRYPSWLCNLRCASISAVEDRLEGSSLVTRLQLGAKSRIVAPRNGRRSISDGSRNLECVPVREWEHRTGFIQCLAQTSYQSRMSPCERGTVTAIIHSDCK